MKKFLKDFFSTSNEINENVIMGVLFAMVLIAATFVPYIDDNKYYVLTGAVLAFFGIGALKK